MTAVEALNELSALLAKSDASLEVKRSLVRQTNSFCNHAVMEPTISLTFPAPPPEVLLKPSKRLSALLAAARAADWERVIVIEHDVSFASLAERALAAYECAV